MTDRIVKSADPGLVDRIAEILFPWLSAEAAAERSGQPLVALDAAGPEPVVELEIGS